MTANRRIDKIHQSKRKYRKRKSNRDIVIQSESSFTSTDSTTVRYDDSTDTYTFSEYAGDMGMKGIDEIIEQNECIHPSSLLSISIEINNFYTVYYEGWLVGKLVRTVNGTADSPIIEMTFLRQNK